MDNIIHPIEWLENELKSQGFLYDLDIEIANDMFQKHIELAYNTGAIEMSNNSYRKGTIYFKETYGKSIV